MYFKGNLDLPGPGGSGDVKKYRVWFKNPFHQWFSRYNIQADVNPTTDNKATDNSVKPPEQGKITTISHSPCSPSDAGSDEPPPRSSTGSMAIGLGNSFRQFKQFQYDLQDNEPEEIVFDVFDLKT